MAARSFSIRTLYQFGFSALITAALVVQFVYGGMVGGFTFQYFALFFGYFTVLSNILVAFVLGIEARASLQKKNLPKWFDQVRGFAVFCIITTGIIYTFFLRGPGAMDQMANALPWANDTFHHIMPIAMTLDWLFFPPRRAAKWVSIIYWVTLTALYAVYVEILGHFSHTYPYFFLDPTDLHGYQGVLRACIAFIPFLAVFAAVTVLLSKFRLSFRGKR